MVAPKVARKDRLLSCTISRRIRSVSSRLAGPTLHGKIIETVRLLAYLLARWLPWFLGAYTCRACIGFPRAARFQLGGRQRSGQVEYSPLMPSARTCSYPPFFSRVRPCGLAEHRRSRAGGTETRRGGSPRSVWACPLEDCGRGLARCLASNCDTSAQWSSTACKRSFRSQLPLGSWQGSWMRPSGQKSATMEQGLAKVER